MFTFFTRSPYKLLRKPLIYSRLKIKFIKICPFLTIFWTLTAKSSQNSVPAIPKSRQNHCPRPSNAFEPCTIVDNFLSEKALFSDLWNECAKRCLPVLYIYPQRHVNGDFPARSLFIGIFSLFLCMTTLQLRTEIKQAIDTIPESLLTDILEHIHELQQQSADKAELIEFLKQSVTEDRELLQKLAEW